MANEQHIQWLQRNVALFRRLPVELRDDLLAMIPSFIDQVKWEGQADQEITEEMQFCIAAEACLPVLRLSQGLKTYRKLMTIQIFPDEFSPTGESPRPGDANARQVRLGWQWVQKGMVDGEDGYNLVLHEFAHIIDFASLDSKADGGLGLTGEQLLGGGAATILGGALLLKSGGKLLGKLGSLGAGVAVGKGLEELAGVQPVYVVNMPSGGFMSGGLGDRFGGPRPGRTGGPLPGSQPGRLPGNSVPRLPGTVAPSTAGRLGSLAMGAGDFIGNKVVPLAAAGAFGWSIGEYAINPLLKATDTQDDVGKFVASLVAALGNKEAQRALRINDGDSDFENSGSRRRRDRSCCPRWSRTNPPRCRCHRRRPGTR